MIDKIIYISKSLNFLNKVLKKNEDQQKADIIINKAIIKRNYKCSPGGQCEWKAINPSAPVGRVRPGSQKLFVFDNIKISIEDYNNNNFSTEIGTETGSPGEIKEQSITLFNRVCVEDKETFTKFNGKAMKSDLQICIAKKDIGEKSNRIEYIEGSYEYDANTAKFNKEKTVPVLKITSNQSYFPFLYRNLQEEEAIDIGTGEKNYLNFSWNIKENSKEDLKADNNYDCYIDLCLGRTNKPTYYDQTNFNENDNSSLLNTIKNEIILRLVYAENGTIGEIKNINEYFNLEIPPKKYNFKTETYEKKNNHWKKKFYVNAIKAAGALEINDIWECVVCNRQILKDHNQLDEGLGLNWTRLNVNIKTIIDKIKDKYMEKDKLTYIKTVRFGAKTSKENKNFQSEAMFRDIAMSKTHNNKKLPGIYILDDNVDWKIIS